MGDLTQLGKHFSNALVFLKPWLQSQLPLLQWHRPPMVRLMWKRQRSHMVTCVLWYQPGLCETLSLREKGVLGSHYFSLLLLNHCCGSQEILQDAIKKDNDSLTTEASGTLEAGQKMAACRPVPRESSESRAAGVSGRGGWDKGHLLKRQLSLSAQHGCLPPTHWGFCWQRKPFGFSKKGTWL